MIKLSFQAAPAAMICLSLDGIIDSWLRVFAGSFGVKFVLEAVEFHRSFLSVLYLMSFIIIAYSLRFFFAAITYVKLAEKGIPKIQKALKEKMYEKARELDLECYDNPEYYNEFVFSISESEKSVDRTREIVQVFFIALTTLITSGIFFMTTDAPSVIFVLASFVLTFFASQLLNKVKYNNRLERNPKERKLSYIHRVFYLNEYAKELRLNPKLRERLNSEFKQVNNDIYEIEKNYALKRTGLQFLVKYVTGDFINDVVYITYLVFRAAVQHVISYSSVVVLWGSTGSMKRSLRMMANMFPQISENSLYIDKIRSFLNYEKKIISMKSLPLPKEPKTLKFMNVSFGYNEKDGYILHNINLTIHPFQKIALVGYNGAGKTTLIKLIMRLYDPTAGEILYNGINIKDYDVSEYREMIGTTFQDFKVFAANVGENIVLDYEDEESRKEHEPAVQDAILYSGFKERVAKMPLGLSTELTTEFNQEGLDLSGGESQKLAIARAFYKDAQLVILDEPSSALDPIAEYQLNESILRATENKTVVFISHRLSTTRNADRIIMLEQGRIIEEGTHEELLTLKDKYAQMWKAQAGKYVDIA